MPRKSTNFAVALKHHMSLPSTDSGTDEKVGRLEGVLLKILGRPIGFYALLLVPLSLGVWTALGAWHVLGFFAVTCVMTGPLALALAIVALVKMWVDNGALVRVMILTTAAACTLLVCWGAVREELALIQWGGILIVAIPALTVSLLVALLFLLAPIEALVVWGASLGVKSGNSR